MSETSDAWLLNTHPHKIAIAAHELIEYIPNPELYRLPLAPKSCDHFIIWRDKMTPVINFSAFSYLNYLDTNNMQVAILAYQNKEEAPLEYGGILLADRPDSIKVGDDQACTENDIPDAWKFLSISGFFLKSETVPILNLNALYLSQSHNVGV